MQSDAVTKERFQLRLQVFAQLFHPRNKVQRGAKLQSLDKLMALSPAEFHQSYQTPDNAGAHQAGHPSSLKNERGTQGTTGSEADDPEKKQRNGAPKKCRRGTEQYQGKD